MRWQIKPHNALKYTYYICLSGIVLKLKKPIS
jgi:hypothetical protein